MQNSSVSPFTLALASHLGRHWIWILLRGLLAVVFGILAFRHPVAAGLSLALLWGAWALAEGVVLLITAWQARGSGRSVWPLVAMGILGVAAGVLTLLVPAATATALLAMIAAWSMATGGLTIITAIRIRKEIEGEWLLGLSGLLSLLFGVVVLVNPAAGGVTIVWLIAAWAVIIGILLIFFAVRVRGLARQIGEAK
jgi:uncharacterized membrane protein HdeD (DUF308 family)